MKRSLETLQEHRQEIDAIDIEMVALLNRRAALVRAIAHLKQDLHMPIHIPEREAEVLKNVRAANQGPIDASALERLFESIIQESRRLEHITIGTADED